MIEIFHKSLLHFHLRKWVYIRVETQITHGVGFMFGFKNGPSLPMEYILQCRLHLFLLGTILVSTMRISHILIPIRNGHLRMILF